MSDVNLIDGKAMAANLRADISRRVALLKERHGVTPGLSVVLVGEDPASEVYVRNKGKSTLEAGMNSATYKLPDSTSHDEVMAKVEELNKAPKVHGILVQLPLPDQVDSDAILNAINPDKDVDGFHTLNVGRLNSGQDAMVPCTPVGCLLMLKEVVGDLTGMQAIVVGRSNIVGKPMAALLLKEHCTVTIAHSRTRDLAGECRILGDGANDDGTHFGLDAQVAGAVDVFREGPVVEGSSDGRVLARQFTVIPRAGDDALGDVGRQGGAGRRRQAGKDDKA